MYRKSRLLLILFLIFILIVLVLPELYPYKYNEIIDNKNLLPSFNHIMGTDYLGRDLFIRIIYATRTSIFISIFSIIISLVFGTVLGMISGHSNGKVDSFILFIINIIQSVPDLLFAMLLVLIYDKVGLNETGIISIISTIALLFWVPIARVIRNEIKIIKNKEYIKYSVKKGASTFYIIRKHYFPNCKDLIIISVLQKIPSAIFIESFLSFLGIGIQPPFPSLGKLINDGLSYSRVNSYQLIFPILILLCLLMMLNFIGLNYMNKKSIKNEV